MSGAPDGWPSAPRGRPDKSFDALVVLDGVDFSVRAREAVGIVGPNGAGKTTLLSVLVGAHAPTSGRVRFRGEDVTESPTAERCRLGLARTHQIPRPFSGMTVFENVFTAAAHGGGLEHAAAYGKRSTSLALTGHDGDRQPARRNARPDRPQAARTRARARDRPRRAAARRDRRRADRRRGERTRRHHPRTQASSGVAIVWIEHIVHILLRVAERLVCMDAGRIIADGAPQSGDGRPGGDRGLSRRRRRVSLLAVERLEARHGLLQAVRGVTLRDRAGRDGRARRRQRRRQDDAAARDRRRASRTPAAASSFKGDDIGAHSAHARAALGHRARSGGTAAVRRPDGRGEPAARARRPAARARGRWTR